MSALVNISVDVSAPDEDVLWVPASIVRASHLNLSAKGALLHLYALALDERASTAGSSPFSTVLRDFGPTASTPNEVKAALGSLMACGVVVAAGGCLRVEELNLEPQPTERIA